MPDLPRVRRLEDALDALPPEELQLRATLLGRLAIVGGANVDATDQVRAWAAEAVAAARATGDPILIAQSLINQAISAKSRSEVDGVIGAADEVVRLAERAGRSDLALHGHQRSAGHYINRGDLGAANESLGSAEVLAALLPSAAWRHSTLLQRTTLLALSGNRSAATAAMDEAARVGAGHIEPVVILGCEAMHQLMLFDLYGALRREDRGALSDRDGHVRRSAIACVAGAEGIRRAVVRRRVERARRAAPIRISARPPLAIDDGRPPVARPR